ncbi:hypothetical protein [Microcoleus sp. OTE_8_concoct_300]|uniref:hypothetical protein n=1 Tax=Microcoleus sp. OTE_8_concoct_300 TaxID=2964710 RepID=UPI00403F2A03
MQKPPPELEGTHDACTGCRARGFLSVLKTCDRFSPSEIFVILKFSFWAALTEKVPLHSLSIE